MRDYHHHHRHHHYDRTLCEMEVASMRTPSCPEPDSNQDPCHDDGREHRPGEDEDDENDDDNDEDEDGEDEN